MAPATTTPPYSGFGPAELVSVKGYNDDMMEPFVSKDGRWLYFNNRNDPGVDTRLHVAERVDGVNFVYRGELSGTNTPALDAVASSDRDGRVYFISTRSYDRDLSTVYRGLLQGAGVHQVHAVPVIAAAQRGILTFDAEIAADGQTLWLADGVFSGAALPDAADLVVARSAGNGFQRDPDSARLLHAVNTRALEYAPAVSADLLELFFTRYDTRARGTVPVILRSSRASATAPFGPPQSLPTVTGFVEAASLSGDGLSLYFHARESGRYVIRRVARAAPP